MPYSPQFMVIYIFVTILIIVTSIGVLLYIEKHHRPDIKDIEIPVTVDKPE